MTPQGITAQQAALLTVAAIRSTAQNSAPSPLRSYVLSITDDMGLPERFPREES